MTQTDILKEIDYQIDSIETLLRRVEMANNDRTALIGQLYQFWAELEAATN